MLKMKNKAFKKLTAGTEARKNKYNAKTTVIDGIKFGSKKEANYYQQLKTQKLSGAVSHFFRQVRCDLPGATKYLLDFLVFYTDGTIRYVEVKGKPTAMGILKLKQAQALYPIQIEIV